MFKRKYISN